MPLNSAALQNGITTVCTAPASSAPGCAQQWADAMRDYAVTVAPPSTTVQAAAAALASSLAGAFASPAAAPGMESAFIVFAASVGVGMVPFAATPPPAPVGFASLFAQPPPPTGAAAAASMAALIDTWMHTATATPPGGAPIPWT